MMTDRLIVIVGPTASGKSELAVRIAKKIGGEIISADSRQIYRGMDIGSGKVEGAWTTHPETHKPVFTYKHIPHYIIDETSPRSQYSVSMFQKKAHRIITDILKRGKVPILCGGTGHWVDAVVYNETLPEVKPNPKLRKELEQESAASLFKRLQKLDPARSKTIDAHNPRRLIRALEIVIATGKPVPHKTRTALYNTTYIGLNPGMEVLEAKIAKRLKTRFKQGMVSEIEQLHTQGISWKRLESFGLEYKYIALYVQGKLTKGEMEQQLFTAIRQYAKRQLTWWKRNKDIQWFSEAKDALHFTLKK